MDKIIIKGGESSKTWQQAEELIEALIAHDMDKNSFILAVGGGALSDLVGFVASIYLRGIPFGIIPTTILAAVDASIGGKNGLNTALYKNLIGTIRQPDIWAFDLRFFSSLPEEEWASGFAEIIKYACITDPILFAHLEEQDLNYYKKNEDAFPEILRTCLKIKANVVQEDAEDKGIRKTLNFGHTLGHAIEKNTNLKHGQAVAIGMLYAAELSSKILGFPKEDLLRLQRLLLQYQLPLKAEIKLNEIWALVLKDKKKSSQSIDFILLESLGKAVIERLEIDYLYNSISQLLVAPKF
jgi:3-dehydroquinate synthase